MLTNDYVEMLSTCQAPTRETFPIIITSMKRTKYQKSIEVRHNRNYSFVRISSELDFYYRKYVVN